MAKIYLCAVALVAMLVLAGCGGSKSTTGGSSSAGSSIDVSSGGGSGKVSRADCQALGEAIDNLALADSMGFDYAKTRTFFDNFNPPAKIHDDFSRVRDFLDKLASVWEDAGVKSGDQPVGDEINKIRGNLPHYSDSDKAKNGQAFTSLNSYNQNGCD